MLSNRFLKVQKLFLNQQKQPGWAYDFNEDAAEVPGFDPVVRLMGLLPPRNVEHMGAKIVLRRLIGADEQQLVSRKL